MDGWDRPEDCMGPETNCSMVRVCSHGFISSSHALTSDWRAEDMDCIIPSIRNLIYLSWMGNIFCYQKTIWMYIKKKQERTLGSLDASGISAPFCGSHFQHLTDVR